jgi:hypothetical protein
MASFEIATQANPALVLPSLLIAGHLEHTTLLPTIKKSFHEGNTLAGKESIKLTFDDGKTPADRAIVHYFAELALGNASPQHASSVRMPT